MWKIFGREHLINVEVAASVIVIPFMTFSKVNVVTVASQIEQGIGYPWFFMYLPEEKLCLPPRI